jgi:hypothetical protein
MVTVESRIHEYYLESVCGVTLNREVNKVVYDDESQTDLSHWIAVQ